MQDLFTSLGLKGGVWQASWQSQSCPARIALVMHGKTLAQAEVQPEGQHKWRIRAPLPAESLSSGVQTFLMIGDDGAGTEPVKPGAIRMGSLSLVAGEALDLDIRAELDLLRAELDLLKREFRRIATEA